MYSPSRTFPASSQLFSRPPAHRGKSRPGGEPIFIEALESRIAPAAIPAVTIQAPTEALIGEPFTFTVTFDNTGSTTGFGPYLDIILPQTGSDGLAGAADDGISFVSATCLGALSLLPATGSPQTVPASGLLPGFVHPFAKDASGLAVNLTSEVAGYQDGDRVISLQLPFGSFPSAEPAVTVQVTVMLSGDADTGAPLKIRAVGGFQYGNDALANPTLPDPTLIGSAADAFVLPTLFTLKKNYLGPEGETATGPNFPESYQIVVDVATGQSVSNLHIVDKLAPNVVFNQGTVTGTPTVPTVTYNGFTTNSNAEKVGGTIDGAFSGTITGAAGPDATMTFSFYVPRLDGNNAVVISPTTPVPATSIDDTSVKGDWIPTDIRDRVIVSNVVVPITVTSDATTNDHTLLDKALALQKGVGSTPFIDVGAPGFSPGDTVQYVLQIQLSDYFAVSGPSVLDTLGDGLAFDPTLVPTLQVNGNGYSFATSNFTTSANYFQTPGPNGTELVNFNIGAELVAKGHPNQLVGGLVNPSGGGFLTGLGDGPTTATIVFYAKIEDRFATDPGSADFSVDHGDILGNSATVRGDVLDTTTLAPNNGTATDVSSAAVAIPVGRLVKSVYAVNGNTNLTQPVHVQPGDLVTYRFTYDLPTSDSDGLTFTDFEPLPIFQVGAVTFPSATPSAAAPLSGVAQFGPLTSLPASYNNLVPAISTNSQNNSITFDFANFPDNYNSSTLGAFDTVGSFQGRIDILFTATVTSDPFADGLFLTNLVHSDEETSNNGTIGQNAVVQVVVDEPALKITKGVVAKTADGTFSVALPSGVAFAIPGTSAQVPSTSPIFTGTIGSGAAGQLGSMNLDGADAGDTVTFAIVIENTGHGTNGAFDVQFRDDMLSSLFVNVGGYHLTDGTGAAVGFTSANHQLSDIFTPAGITLNDPGATATPTGGIDPVNAPNGRNVIVLTFDATIKTGIQVCEVLSNTATLLHYSNQEGGADFVPLLATPSDNATVTIACPTAVKTIVTTSEAHTGVVGGSTQVAVGEIVRYRVVTTVPEGVSTNLVLRDNLPIGLSFLNDGTAKVALISTGGTGLVGPGLPSANVPGNDASLPFLTLTNPLPAANITPGVFASGDDVFFTFGTVTNVDNDADHEYLVIEFNALVNNISAVQAGVTLNNTATTIAGELIRHETTSASVPVVVVEPNIGNFGKVARCPDGEQFQAGEAIPYVISFTNFNSAFSTAAFDVHVIDPLAPNFLTAVTGLVVKRNGVPIPSTGFTLGSPNSLEDLVINRVNAGDSIQVFFNATLAAGTPWGANVENEADVNWTSLPGPNGTAPNPTGSVTPGVSGTFNGERNGDGGVNDYALHAACAAILTDSPIVTKTVLSTSNLETDVCDLNPFVTDVSIGETVTYSISVTLPAGSTSSLVLSDLLPVGSAGAMQVASASVVSVGSHIFPGMTGVPIAADVNGDGIQDRVIIDFGATTVTAGGAEDRTILIQISALVLNDPDNVPGLTLVNDATFAFDNGSATATANVEVVTPMPGPTVGHVSTIPDPRDPSLTLLLITGTVGNDSITVKEDPNTGGITVMINGQTQPNGQTKTWFPTGDIVICGDSGNDKINLSGVLTHSVTIYGDAGNDTLLGGKANDFLYGGTGIDTLKGGEGNDDLHGGSDKDTLDGGLGDDILHGDNGLDTLLGGDGDDLLYGGADKDILHGDSGKDILRGEDGDDTLSGDIDDDILYGGRGADALTGGTGNDVLLGGADSDLMHGGTGRDLLIAGASHTGLPDRLYGDQDEDILIGGTTSHDNNVLALRDIMREWTAAATYASRIAHLTGTSGGQNGATFLIAGTSVIDNATVDVLLGGTQRDFFFAHTTPPPDSTDRVSVGLGIETLLVI